MWLAMMESGVHATLAGVLTAMMVPARSKCQAPIFSTLIKIYQFILSLRYDSDNLILLINIMMNALCNNSEIYNGLFVSEFGD
jgi:Na+/H+ antiporter NhaA